MLGYAAALAERKGLTLPRGLKRDSRICRAFLSEHAEPRAAGAVAGSGPRAPSDAMLRYARNLAEQRGVPCPPEVEADFAACRAFLDAHADRRPAGTAAVEPARARRPRAAGTGATKTKTSATSSPKAPRRRAARAEPSHVPQNVL